MIRHYKHSSRKIKQTGDLSVVMKRLEVNYWQKKRS